MADAPAKRLAIVAEALYLANLMIAPGIAWLLLALLWGRYGRSAAKLARCHLGEALRAGLWSGVMLLLVTAALMAFGNRDQPGVWVVAILYFVSIHASFILLGVLALVKAINGECWRYPLIGRFRDD